MSTPSGSSDCECKRVGMAVVSFFTLALPAAAVLLLSSAATAQAPAASSASSAEENLRVASKKMDELTAAAAQLPKSGAGFDPIGSRYFGYGLSGGDPRWRVNSQLANIKRNYESMSRSDAASAAQWYRSQVEGKTIYDFADEEARPEYRALAETVQAEKMRIYRSISLDELSFYKYLGAMEALAAEANERFPKNKMAQFNWFLDLVRGKSGDDLAAIVEQVRPGQRPASAEKPIDLTAATGKSVDVNEAVSKIKAHEAKLKNAQWHFVYATGHLERWDDFSSFKPKQQTQKEGNVVYDFETDRYRVEMSGTRQWPQGMQRQPGSAGQWVQIYVCDGENVRTFQDNGPSSTHGTIARNSDRPNNYSGDSPFYVLAQTGYYYFLNGSVYGLQTPGARRLSQQLELTSKNGQLKITQRDNGIWMITDASRPARIAYDPAKGAMLGAQFLSRKGGGFFMPVPAPPKPAAPPGATKSGTATPAAKTDVNEPTVKRPPPSSLFNVMRVLKIELQQVGDFWLPKIASNVSYAEANSTSRLEFSQVKINENLPADIFKIEFPSGTFVHDQIENKRYRVAQPARGTVPTSPPSGLVAPQHTLIAPPSGVVASPQTLSSPPSGIVAPPQTYSSPPSGAVARSQAPAVAIGPTYAVGPTWPAETPKPPEAAGISWPTWISVGLASAIAVLIGVIVVMRRNRA